VCRLTFELTPTTEAGRLARVADDDQRRPHGQDGLP
jgi:hypothetical protein